MSQSAVNNKQTTKLISRRKTVNSIIAKSTTEQGNASLIAYIKKHELLRDLQEISNKVYGNLNWCNESIPVAACKNDNGDVLFIPIDRRFAKFPANCNYCTVDILSDNNYKIRKSVVLTARVDDTTLYNVKVHCYKMSNGQIFRDIIFVTTGKVILLEGLSLKS